MSAQQTESKEKQPTQPPVRPLFDHRTMFSYDEVRPGHEWEFHGSSPTVVPRKKSDPKKEYKRYKKYGGDFMDLEDAEDDYMWRHHYLYGHPQSFSEPPSPGFYGSRGPLFDETTGSGAPTATLPAAKPSDQK